MPTFLPHRAALLGLLLATSTGLTLAAPAVIPRTDPHDPASATLAQVLDQQGKAEGWCVVWNAPFEPVGPAPEAWRSRGPGDSLDRMVERGVDDWDRGTSATWQITAAEDFQPNAVHARIFLTSRTVEIVPSRAEDRSPPNLPPLRWGHCPPSR